MDHLEKLISISTEGSNFLNQINLNLDCGEYFGSARYFEHDEKMMPYLKYANIACGGHCGDEDVMQLTVELAAQHQVTIGAHPSYPDPENFGRVSMVMDENTLTKNLASQIVSLQRVCDREKLPLIYVKPHGALYNDALKYAMTAKALLEAMRIVDPKLKVMTMPNSVLAKLAIENGLEVLSEAFADRNYLDANTLVPRTQDNAVILNPSEVIENIAFLAKNQIKTINGEIVPIELDTICIHGDHPNILGIANALKNL